MEFLTVAILHLFAVASPGPDFALITRQSLRYSRKVAVWTSLGIGVGILFHSLLAITGIVLLITSNELFLMILKTLGSLYLLFLGINSILSSKEIAINESKNLDKFNGFLAGLITNITNIKAILLRTKIIYTSKFNSVYLRAVDILRLKCIEFSSITRESIRTCLGKSVHKI